MGLWVLGAAGETGVGEDADGEETFNFAAGAAGESDHAGDFGLQAEPVDADAAVFDIDGDPGCGDSGSVGAPAA
eukprot:6997176-Lingulodinium_polyedra.AAC.1